MAKKGWTWAPGRLQKPKVPEDLKAEVTAKADGLVEQFLKPNFIKKPPKKPRWNYIIAIHTKWHHSFFYFVATFRSPGPTAITPTFEAPFTRLEYVGHRRFWEVADQSDLTIRRLAVFDAQASNPRGVDAV